MHDAILEDGQLYAKGENGERGSLLENIDLEGITADFLAGELTADLANLDQYALAQKINEAAQNSGRAPVFNEDQMVEFYQNAQEDWRKSSFTEEAKTRGFDVDELKDYAGYLAHISDKTED